MSQRINESTSVIQVDSSRLQNGQVSLVYVSTTTIPGQLVTVVDATGFTSSPQGILISTTGGALFSDGSFSTLIQQRYGYLTLVSRNTSTWTSVNVNSFPSPAANPVVYKSLDTESLVTGHIRASGLLSTNSMSSILTTATSSATFRSLLYASTLYVNSVPRYISSSPIDVRLTVNGAEYINGLLTATGAGSFRSSISTMGDFFNTGNISSKVGTIYVGGDVTTAGTIRGQRGTVISVLGLSTFASAGFVGPAFIASSVTVGTSARARAISTVVTQGTSMNVFSSIAFGPTQLQRIVYTPGFLAFTNLPITVPSTVSSLYLTASNAITTSSISIESFGPASTLAYFTMSSTQITNAAGSLSISSVGGNACSTGQTATRQCSTTTLSLNTATFNDVNPGVSSYSIAIPSGTLSVPSYWLISSVGTRGTLNAPFTTISTQTLVGRTVTAAKLDTVNDIFENFYTQTVNVGSAVALDGMSTLSINNVFVNNTGGSVTGTEIDMIGAVHCSSMKADQISGPVFRVGGSNTFSLPESYISSVTAGSMTTSSLVVSNIFTGASAAYSTISPSTPWMLISTYQMNNPPFTTTHGLGTYFNEVYFIAASDQTAYYSIIDPSTQTPIHLSTPYVNTIATTGPVAGQPASDSSGNIYVGANIGGWRLQKISPTKTVTTLAGNYRFFYGDGKFPLNAAFGPQLAVSMGGIPGTLIITDSSNVRIRYVTNDPIVTTIAGTGASAYTGDGGLAFNAAFSTPAATVTDLSGRLFIADSGNHVIRAILGSTIVTYAGTGVDGYAGDGGPAGQATLKSPYGLTVDSARNLLVSDPVACVIRTISPTSTINTLAGTGTPGFSGDGAASIFATLSSPKGITVDSANNLYICDTDNNRVRRIDGITQVITTVAGNGTGAYGGDNGLATLANLSSPTGVAADSLGNLYVSDTNNQCIRYVNIATNRITTVAGQPTRQGYSGDRSFATFALMNTPTHLAFDPGSGYYYIADNGNARIRYVNSATRIIFSAAGNGSPITAGDSGPAIDAVFGSITSVATDSRRNIYITDALGQSIRRIDAVTSTIQTIAGTGVGGFSGDGGLATAARISSPQTMVVDSNSNLYFTDTGNQRVRRILASTSTITTVAGTGVAGYNGDSISSIQATLNYPTGLTIDSGGNLFVADSQNFRIRRLDSTGYITTYVGNGLYGALSTGRSFVSTPLGLVTAITVDANSTLYLADSTTSALWKMNVSTQTTQLMSALSTPAYLGDAGPLSNAYFNAPTGLVCYDGSNLVIADNGNRRIRQTYTFGNPLNPAYLNMEFTFTNYFTTSGYGYITLNGNLLTTFDAALESNITYRLTDANLLNYPLQNSNPVYGNQVPYIEITQVGTIGYTKLEGTLWMDDIPSQELVFNSVDSNAGIVMNRGTLVFPYKNNGITIANPYNDISLRTLYYTGSLVSASDPALKEDIRHADLGICRSTLEAIPLRTYAYSEPYRSTFQVRDTHRLGFLTSEVAPQFPNSITSRASTEPWAPSTINTLDTTQILYSHLGMTQGLIQSVSTLESEAEDLQRVLHTLRRMVAQRNSVL